MILKNNTFLLIFTCIIFNFFLLKMIFDSGLQNVKYPFLFFHFVVSILCAVFCYTPNDIKHPPRLLCFIQLTALPSFIFLFYHFLSSFLEILIYQLFLTGITTSTLLIAHYFYLIGVRPRLSSFITFILLWGSNLIIETIPRVYNSLAPYTISYHFNLITDGILHISTPIYLLTLIGIPLGLLYEKKI